MYLNAAMYLDAARHAAGLFTEPFDQGFGPIRLGHPGLDVTQPCQIGLARLITQGELGILQLPK